jgi:hypothetical protein
LGHETLWVPRLAGFSENRSGVSAIKIPADDINRCDEGVAPDRIGGGLVVDAVDDSAGRGPDNGPIKDITARAIEYFPVCGESPAHDRLGKN